ncbi:DNA-deoxyinosine glycosylase [Sporolactobacillus pectinivorans]|uniref:DNA-deoxyinosine glycosylase n=1 Tax=Sporolactobacillus pectinivorans TaxID=1591408 RepID=UPI001EFED6EE|nr:DNA-deoxyinosine glycosylase [Sporolactobacillus pectinivorans]
MGNKSKLHFSMKPIIGAGARVLILGSMPGHISLVKQQYYANPRNQFWRIMRTLLGREAEFIDYDDKCAFLKRQRIALWDTIHQCTREGSLDSAIRDEEPNKIFGLLQEYPEVRLIAFNGTKSFAVFRKYFKTIPIGNRDLVCLPSTSPTPGRYSKTFGEKLAVWQIIKDYLK